MNALPDPCPDVKPMFFVTPSAVLVARITALPKHADKLTFSGVGPANLRSCFVFRCAGGVSWHTKVRPLQDNEQTSFPQAVTTHGHDKSRPVLAHCCISITGGLLALPEHTAMETKAPAPARSKATSFYW